MDEMDLQLPRNRTRVFAKSTALPASWKQHLSQTPFDRMLWRQRGRRGLVRIHNGACWLKYEGGEAALMFRMCCNFTRLCDPTMEGKNHYGYMFTESLRSTNAFQYMHIIYVERTITDARDPAIQCERLPKLSNLVCAPWPRLAVPPVWQLAVEDGVFGGQYLLPGDRFFHIFELPMPRSTFRLLFSPTGTASAICELFHWSVKRLQKRRIEVHNSRNMEIVELPPEFRLNTYKFA